MRVLLLLVRFHVRALCLFGVLLGGTTVAGCGPSTACQAYVECQELVDPSVDTSPWDDGGACWVNLQTAQACTAQCTAALDALAALPDAPSACVQGAETAAGAS